MPKVQTENSYLGAKLKLRIDNLPAGETIRVLDCFSAHGTLWREIKRLTGRKIEVLRMKERTGLTGIYLEGDNLKFLAEMDLSGFDVIDLDAFGVPADQLELVLPRAQDGTVIFVTFIQSVMGVMPMKLLNANGLTDEMIKKAPTLFGKSGWKYFLNFLALNGVKKVRAYNYSRKHYLAFVKGETGQRVSGYGSRPADKVADHA